LAQSKPDSGNLRKLFGGFPKKAKFFDKVVRMNNFDKKFLPIGKEFVILQP
jgi:hypothetical protein